MAVSVVLTIVIVVLAFTLGLHWLWIVGLVGALIAIVIGRLIGGGLGPGSQT